MEFTYDIADLVMLSPVLRMIGRSMRSRLARIAATLESDPKLRRRFLPVWHQDILQSVKYKPRLLIEMLAREASMINGLIEWGTTPGERNQNKFLKRRGRQGDRPRLSRAGAPGALDRHALPAPPWDFRGR
jgi:hypothetical protein